MRNFFLSVSFIVPVKVCIFPLNMHDIIIYVARRWEKYLSKRHLIKHTCSWRDKLIVLWTLNRQAKIFLRVGIFSIASETLLLIILYLSNKKQSIIVLIASKISCACYFKKDWCRVAPATPEISKHPRVSTRSVSYDYEWTNYAGWTRHIYTTCDVCNRRNGTRIMEILFTVVGVNKWGKRIEL